MDPQKHFGYNQLMHGYVQEVLNVIDITSLCFVSAGGILI